MANERCFFLCCGGLGMGNASRVFAVAQAAARQSPGTEIHFFTWGRGYAFLRRAIEESSAPFHLHRLEAYPWGKKTGLLRSLGSYARIYFTNTRILARKRAELRPSAILLDSDYHFIPFLAQRGRLFYLGQALDVVSRARRFRYRPRRFLSWASLIVCEVADGILQCLLSRRVFVPSFLEHEAFDQRGKLVRVPLIVREEFRSAGRGVPVIRAGGVSGGSGIGSEHLGQVLASLGASLLVTPGNEVRLSSPGDFQRAETVVVQGGLTSISECIALGKPMIVVPIRGRAEQEVNARTVELLGLGVSCDELLPAGKGVKTASSPPRILVNGADVVARNVLAHA